MSLLPSPSRAPTRPRWRATWLRWIALLVLVFAAAPAQEVTTRVLSALVVHAADECEDEGSGGCKAGDCCPGPCCPGPCEACACCRHGSGYVVATVLALPSGRIPEAELPGARPFEVSAVGYRSPPFRPPTG